MWRSQPLSDAHVVVAGGTAVLYAEVTDVVSSDDGEPHTLPVEIDAATGDGGWVLPFAVDASDADDAQVEVTIEMTDAEPALITDGFSKVVDVSIHAPAVLGEGGLAVTASERGTYRLRFMLDDSNRPPRLVVHSWPAPLAPARLDEPNPPGQACLFTISEGGGQRPSPAKRVPRQRVPSVADPGASPVAAQCVAASR